MMALHSPEETPQAATSGGFRFGYRVLCWALLANLLGALACLRDFSLFPAPLRLVGMLAAVLREMTLGIQLISTVVWLPLGIVVAMRDISTGHIQRDHAREMGGRFGFSFTLIAFVVMVYEMCFHAVSLRP